MIMSHNTPANTTGVLALRVTSSSRPATGGTTVMPTW